MNYYIVTEEVFGSLDKDQIQYAKKNREGSQRLIGTTEQVNDRIRKFNNINTCSNYTYTVHQNWVGDGTGVDIDELETSRYIKEIDN
nr:hypothetical protein [uncultured Mediterranean phage uvMED]